MKKFHLAERCRWGLGVLFCKRTTGTMRTGITGIKTTVSNKIHALATEQKFDWKRIGVNMV